MPEAHIRVIPNTKLREVVVAFPSFETPGRTIIAYPYSTEVSIRAALDKLRALGLHVDDAQSKLESETTIKW